jgi:hypothetical protein
MASRRKNSDAGPVAVSSPAQQDEADILEEVEGEQDEESGDILVDEAKIREVGAVDAASVIENRRMNTAVKKKRNGEKNIRFNAGDALSAYDAAVKTWPPNTLDIIIRRLTGTPVTYTIMSRPRSGAELYDALMLKHGQYEEAEYEVKAIDNNLKQFRVNSRITLPDTRSNVQQGQPMNPQYPYGAPPIPPGYPPQYAQPYPPPQPPQAYPPQQQAAPAQPQAAPQPQQPPQVFVHPPAFDPSSAMSMMNEMFGIFRQMQSAAQPPPQPPPQYQPPAPQPQMPPPLSPQATPQEMMAWMQEAFRMFEQMRMSVQPPPQAPPAPSRSDRYAQPPPQTPNPMAAMGMMGMPPMQPPPGTMWVPGFGFVPAEALVRAIGGAAPGPGSGPEYRPPYRGPRPAYGPPGGRPPYYAQDEQGPPPAYQGPPQAPQREKTVAEQFRESVMVVRQAADVMREMGSILPQQNEPQEVSTPEEDDSPIKIIDTGKGKIAVNREDGSMRLWESGFANLSDILQWGGEQITKINKANADRQAQQQPPPRRELPPGYVEVTEGYRPPPGYVAVPVPVEQPLPPPPAHMPPPVQTEPAPTRQTWEAPTIQYDQGENTER